MRISTWSVEVTGNEEACSIKLKWSEITLENLWSGITCAVSLLHVPAKNVELCSMIDNYSLNQPAKTLCSNIPHYPANALCSKIPPCKTTHNGGFCIHMSVFQCHISQRITRHKWLNDILTNFYRVCTVVICLQRSFCYASF